MRRLFALVLVVVHIVACAPRTPARRPTNDDLEPGHFITLQLTGNREVSGVIKRVDNRAIELDTLGAGVTYLDRSDVVGVGERDSAVQRRHDRVAAVREVREPNVGLAVGGGVILVGGVSASVAGLVACQQPPRTGSWGADFSALPGIIGGVIGIVGSVSLGAVMIGFGAYGSRVDTRPTIRAAVSLGGAGVQGEW